MHLSAAAEEHHLRRNNMTRLNVIAAALGVLMAGAIIPAYAMDHHGMKEEMKSEKMMNSDKMKHDNKMMKEDDMMDSDPMDDDGMMKKDDMMDDHHMDKKKKMSH
jgi:hypothetical protein